MSKFNQARETALKQEAEAVMDETALPARRILAQAGYELPPRLKVEVVADSTGQFCGNGLRFKDVDEAIAYGMDLGARWTLVEKYRVINCDTGEVLWLEEVR